MIEQPPFETTNTLKSSKKEENEKAEEGKSEADVESEKVIDVPPYIYIDFIEDRSCCNRILYLLYKGFRSFYITFWFYFLPFTVITLSFVTPYVSGTYPKIFDGDCNPDIEVNS